MHHAKDTSTNKAYGLLGRSIAYTQSPRIYAPWFEKHLIAASFDVIDLPYVDEAVLVQLSDQYAGFCITVPYKQIIFEILMRRLISAPETVHISPLTLKCGAVNVVRFDKGKIVATNTDAMALASLLPALSSHDEALIIGAGGAARATITTLKEAGVSNIVVIGRSTTADVPAGVRYVSMASPDDHNVCDHSAHMAMTEVHPTLLINATPLGAGRNDDETWLKNILALVKSDQLRCVVDWVYGDEPTQLAQWSTAKDLPVIDGVTLLRTQAKFAFQHWFGFLPD